MDDLIDWFAEANGFSGGTKAPHKWVLQAEQELRIHAAALSEAAATIARQQVMLDRALESNGDMQAEVARRWQQIETAPKDGTEIIGSWQCLNKTWDMNKLCFVDGMWLDHYHDCQFNPTHWMPLPEPPTSA